MHVRVLARAAYLFAAFVAFSLGCADGAPGQSDGGAPGATGTGGNASGSGGAAAGTGGGAGAAPVGGNGGTAGSPSGVDKGNLFTDAATVPDDVGGPPPADGGAGETSGPVIPGDGNMATASINSMGLRAVFTQKGADVTVVVTATRCPPGNHVLEIHEGFACDDPTRGMVWGMGRRGGGITPMVCTAAQQGSLTYTRSGADPMLKWTVGDHNKDTDVTLRPIFVGTNCGTFF